MDFFAHGFWGFLFFHRYRWRWVALFFAMLPDISSWFLFSIYNMFHHAVDWGSRHPPDFSGVPNWTWTLYNISHSLIVWGAAILLVYAILRRWYWPMFAGVISIAMDIPTHTEHFLPTPFLWPVSDFRFPGISWGSWWFMIINYSVLALAYTYFFVYTPWKNNSDYGKKGSKVKPRRKAKKAAEKRPKTLRKKTAARSKKTLKNKKK
jgi:hypothetical protein